MRPIQPITLTATGTSNWVVLDQYATSSDLTVEMDITGTATAQVDYSDDDPFNPPAGGMTVGGQLIASGSTTAVKQTSNIPKAVRLNCTAYTSGNVVLKVNQRGII